MQVKRRLREKQWVTDGCFPTLATIEQHPIVYTIILLSQGPENLGKKFAKEVIIGSLFKSKLADVIHVDRKFLCNTCMRTEWG